jgi:hypothetical protein
MPSNWLPNDNGSRGATLRYCTMPTKYECIGVIKDEELAVALDSVAPLVGTDIPAATLVRNLAIRGAQALREEEGRRRESIDRLVEWSTGVSEPPWDPQVLAQIDDLTAE